MHTDAFFAIGKTHEVCQDYAVAGQTKAGSAYAIVSDGCSSSPRTDFGARFLVTAAESFIHKYDKIPAGSFVTAQADALRKILDLPQTCLDATLMMALWGHNGCQVSTFGDGVCVFIYDNGGVVRSIDYEHGAPGYLSYGLNPPRQDVYIHESENYKRTVNGWPLHGPYGDWNINYRGSGGDSFQPGHRERVNGVLLFSDGLQSFQSHHGGVQAVHVNDVLEQVLAFKGMQGQFLTRRCKKFLHKFCVTNQWQHGDDFSCAAIMRPEP